ncbi:MAG TPA: YkgJ family cysteine cluster protein [Candidatus Hydrogenedentes bacterium]|nr:YkgJ family cysteine cluster protein [Candidatus Hydrogenedentota bacterium]HPG66594.1 YkgJ family cysteine cluster protein [Candidatus Hydrogenedentota bacterium]
MHVETDLKKVRRLAEKRDEENWRFRTFLKQYDGNDLDERVHRLLAEVSAQIDCTACGNCCAALGTELSDADIKRLSEGLDMTPEAFCEKYTEKDEGSGVVMLGQPCPFLKDKRCTVYPRRPDDCRHYPYLQREGFVSRLMGVVSNYAVCPIVFNVYERLKDDLWPPWRRYGKTSRTRR